VHAHRTRADPRFYEQPDVHATDRRRLIAATLSALVPGLGQAGNANLQLAVLFGVPSAVLLFIAWLLMQGNSTTRIVATLMVPATLGPVLVLNGIVLTWRLAAVVQAFLDRRYRVRPSARSIGVLGLILAFVALPHLVAGWLGYSAYDNFRRIFAAPAAATATPGPGDRERLNILLMGVDSGPSRAHALTDTLIVVSLDPVARKVSMLSIPRDMTDVPLGDGNTFAPKINSLMAFADRNRNEFPAGGVKALEGAVETLLGIPIHYYARVNLGGFVRMVDSVGGVDINVVKPLADPNYGGYGVGPGWSITKGAHHFDGANALAYARIRKAEGESDFTRAERQQEVLVAIRDAATKGNLVFRLTDLLDAVGDTVRTDLPADRLPGLAALAEEIDEADTTRVVIRAPLLHAASNAYGAVQVPNVVSIRAMAARLFPAPGADPVPWPTPRPTKAPRPTPSPSS
jgi:polyisoprenyl-teichoic acid--peptidoglycan teichoic acid transferase